jgi:hypothetical protein
MPGTVVKDEAIEKYRVFFSAGSLLFTVGMDVNGKHGPPSSHYYALEGQTILHVDCKLALPSVDLLCYNCNHFRNTTIHLKGKNSSLSGRIRVYLHGVLQ